MAIYDIYVSPMYGYKAVKRALLRFKSQGAKLGEKGYRHVGTTSAKSPEQAIHQSRSDSFDTEPELVQARVKSYNDTEQVGALENVWATSLIIKLLMQHNLDTDDIPPNYLITFKTLALSLKDEGMSKEDIAEAVNLLATKHGGLLQMLKTYSEMFGI